MRGVNGASTYQLEFLGLGADPRAPTKAFETGAQQPITAGEVKRAVYASMQCCTSIINPNGQAIVVRPATPVPAKVGSKQVQRTRDNNQETLEVSQILLTLPGNTVNKLEIYGGFNELVRLDQEKFASLPGLFEPNIFGQLSLGLIRFLEAIRGVVGSWGLAIIALTLLIRVLITPLLMQQYRSGAEMQALQPFLADIREKHKGDPQKIQEETMKVYTANGVNPVSGCLPALIQMPVLLVLWRVFSNYEFDQGFLWIKDLSLPDQWYILPVLYVISGAISTWLATRKTPEMFRQSMIIQVVFAYIYLSFPAGVTLYGVVGGLLGAAQQWVITQQVERQVAAKAAAKGIIPPSVDTKKDEKSKTINTKAKKSS
jgi:YidC/Oxa1 family membrane protein insertase